MGLDVAAGVPQRVRSFALRVMVRDAAASDVRAHPVCPGREGALAPVPTRLRPRAGGRCRVSVKTLGNYELEGLLGEGGIGQVYAAQDKVLGRQVAIKALRPELSRDHNFVERFYNEAKSLANLNHTNIATLYALHVEGSEAFMVMELVHGQTLEALLARVGRLTLRDSLAILAQAVPGIRYAHRRGVIHRDLKPANLMVTDDGVVKIMDFGIARVRGSEHLTRVGEFCGTFVYASPEQIRGEDVDERSDLYSLAIVLYRMLAGSPPFQSDNEYALMTAQLQAPPPPLAGRVPGVDAATEAVLMRALAKRREDRYASVEEFGRAVGAMALREESVDILQQLYAHAITDGDAEATRIISPRHVPVVEPVPSSRPSLRDTADWQLPPALADADQAVPQPSARDAGRRSVFDEAPARAMDPIPRGGRHASRRRWPFIAAPAMFLLAASGYYIVSEDLVRLPFFSKPSPGIVERPTPPEPPPSPVKTVKEEPPPAPPPVTPSKEEPPPGPPPVKTVEEKPPPASPSVKTVEEEPPPAPPPVKTVEEEPPPAPPPVKTVEEEPPPAPPPVKIAKEEPPPAPPPLKTVEEEPPPAPPPLKIAKEEPPPAPPPVKAIKEEPPPAPPPVKIAKEEPPPVHQLESPQPALGPLASLGPERARGEPEGKPDLQGKVTGAKRLDEIEVDGRWIRIYGIVDRARGAQEAQHVSALVRYLKPSHNHIVCYRKASGTYRCYSDGQDIARLALEDGMVGPTPNAPPEYHVLPTARR
jgi:eukaryotic-like serine/threonine-protein kinase